VSGFREEQVSGFREEQVSGFRYQVLGRDKLDV